MQAVTIRQPEKFIADVSQELKASLTSQAARVIEVSDALAPAYAKASTLELTDDEVARLTAPFPDEAVEIRPHDGLIYLPHILISGRLNQVFKPGKWSLICRRHWLEGQTMYAEYVLVIRGCFVGESVGGHNYVPSNPKMNYSDALESTAAEALRRICGKRLECGSQVWHPEYARQWVAKYAVQDRGKWGRKAFTAVSSHSDAVPASVKPPAVKTPGNPIQAPPEANPEERKTRFLALFKGMESYAFEEFVERSWILCTEDLADIHVDSVPKTLKAVNAVVTAVKMRAGIVDEPPVTTPAEPTPNVSGCEQITGVIDQVTTKSGKSDRGPWTCYGIRIGDFWANTFSDTIGKTAQKLKGHEVTVYYSAGKIGNDIRALSGTTDLLP